MKADEPECIVLEPDWEVLCLWFANAMVQHAFQRFAREPVISFIEQIRYLAQSDPEALDRVISRLQG